MKTLHMLDRKEKQHLRKLKCWFLYSKSKAIFPNLKVWLHLFLSICIQCYDSASFSFFFIGQLVI